jgi:hypothetical protein
MTTTLKHKIVKIRRPKICIGCATKGEKGQKMVYWVGVCEGEFQDSYWCLCCDAYLETLGNDEEGISFGEFAGEPDYLRFKHNFYDGERCRK